MCSLLNKGGRHPSYWTLFSEPQFWPFIFCHSTLHYGCPYILAADWSFKITEKGSQVIKVPGRNLTPLQPVICWFFSVVFQVMLPHLPDPHILRGKSVLWCGRECRKHPRPWDPDLYRTSQIGHSQVFGHECICPLQRVQKVWRWRRRPWAGCWREITICDFDFALQIPGALSCRGQGKEERTTEAQAGAASGVGRKSGPKVKSRLCF